MPTAIWFLIFKKKTKNKKKNQMATKLNVTLYHWTMSKQLVALGPSSIFVIIGCYVSGITLDIWNKKLLGWKNEQLVCFGTKVIIYLFIYFPIAALWNSLKWNVIQQIKKLWPNVRWETPVPHSKSRNIIVLLYHTRSIIMKHNGMSFPSLLTLAKFHISWVN